MLPFNNALIVKHLLKRRASYKESVKIGI